MADTDVVMTDATVASTDAAPAPIPLVAPSTLAVARASAGGSSNALKLASRELQRLTPFQHLALLTRDWDVMPILRDAAHAGFRVPLLAKLDATIRTQQEQKEQEQKMADASSSSQQQPRPKTRTKYIVSSNSPHQLNTSFDGSAVSASDNSTAMLEASHSSDEEAISLMLREVSKHNRRVRLLAAHHQAALKTNTALDLSGFGIPSVHPTSTSTLPPRTYKKSLKRKEVPLNTDSITPPIAPSASAIVAPPTVTQRSSRSKSPKTSARSHSPFSISNGTPAAASSAPGSAPSSPSGRPTRRRSIHEAVRMHGWTLRISKSAITYPKEDSDEQLRPATPSPPRPRVQPATPPHQQHAAAAASSSSITEQAQQPVRHSTRKSKLQQQQQQQQQQVPSESIGVDAPASAVGPPHTTVASLTPAPGPAASSVPSPSPPPIVPSPSSSPDFDALTKGLTLRQARFLHMSVGSANILPEGRRGATKPHVPSYVNIDWKTKRKEFE